MKFNFNYYYRMIRQLYRIQSGQITRNLSTATKIHQYLPFQLNSNYIKQSQLTQISPHLVYLIDQFFSLEECQRLISQTPGLQFQEAHVNRQLQRSNDKAINEQTTISRKDIRNNLKLVFDHPSLATQMFQRLTALNLPINASQLLNSGTYTLQSCNARMKIYQYLSRQYFKRHRDGIYIDNQNQTHRRYTFMVYLNDNFIGGETQFHISGHSPILVRPKQGQALIFFHNLIYEGLPTHLDQKYVLRSDLMFK